MLSVVKQGRGRFEPAVVREAEEGEGSLAETQRERRRGREHDEGKRHAEQAEADSAPCTQLCLDLAAEQ